MRSSLVFIACGAVACGVGGQPPPVNRPPAGSWSSYMLSAQEHDQRAAAHKEAADRAAELARAPGSFACGDTVLNDQLTTGGTRVTSWQPCFDVSEEAVIEQRAAADQEIEAARRDRRTAARLVRAEVAACGGIADRERAHSLFEHRTAIAEVLPHREAGQIRGVWIVFKPVIGMTADWVRRDIDCGRARWAVLGKQPDVALEDPTLVPGADVRVFDRKDHVEVLVVTETTDAGAVALARAAQLAAKREQTAVR